MIRRSFQDISKYLEYGMKAFSPRLHSLQRWRLQADLITAFKIFTGLLDIDSNLFFLPLVRSGLRGHPYKVLQGASHRRRRGSAFSVRVVKYWNNLPVSVCLFKKRLDHILTDVCPHHFLLNTHFPNSLYLHLPLLYIIKFTVQPMWFLPARCGLLFTFINHNYVI